MKKCLSCENPARLRVEQDASLIYCSDECYVGASFSDLPLTSVMNIALHTDPATLIALCQTKMKYRQICYNPEFRYEYMKRNIQLFKRIYWSKMRQGLESEIEEHWIDLLMHDDDLFTDEEIELISRSYYSATSQYYLIYYRRFDLTLYQLLDDVPFHIINAFEKTLRWIRSGNMCNKLKVFMNTPNIDVILRDVSIQLFIGLFAGKDTYECFKILTEYETANEILKAKPIKYAQTIAENDSDLDYITSALNSLASPLPIQYNPQFDLPNLRGKVRLLIEHPNVDLDTQYLLLRCTERPVTERLLTLVLSDYVKHNGDVTAILMMFIYNGNPTKVSWSKFTMEEYGDTLSILLKGAQGFYNPVTVFQIIEQVGYTRYLTAEQKSLLGI